MTLREVPSSQYTRFIRWLKRNYPLKKKGVKVTVDLLDKPFVPFKLSNGNISEAEATVCIVPGGMLIRVAVGRPSKKLRDVLIDIAHEHRHVIQYHDQGLKFESYAHLPYYENPLESDAQSFALKVVREYERELNSK